LDGATQKPRLRRPKSAETKGRFIGRTVEARAGKGKRAAKIGEAREA